RRRRARRRELSDGPDGRNRLQRDAPLLPRIHGHRDQQRHRGGRGPRGATRLRRRGAGRDDRRRLLTGDVETAREKIRPRKGVSAPISYLAATNRDLGAGVAVPIANGLADAGLGSCLRRPRPARSRVRAEPAHRRRVGDPLLSRERSSRAWKRRALLAFLASRAGRFASLLIMRTSEVAAGIPASTAPPPPRSECRRSAERQAAGTCSQNFASRTS